MLRRLSLTAAAYFTTSPSMMFFDTPCFARVALPLRGTICRRALFAAPCRRNIFWRELASAMLLMVYMAPLPLLILCLSDAASAAHAQRERQQYSAQDFADAHTRRACRCCFCRRARDCAVADAMAHALRVNIFYFTRHAAAADA